MTIQPVYQEYLVICTTRNGSVKYGVIAASSTDARASIMATMPHMPVGCFRVLTEAEGGYVEVPCDPVPSIILGG